MRIAIVSDIHGSLSALDAVLVDMKRQGPDLVLHGGDLVVNGPRPVEVVDTIRELGWPGVVGNTDEILWAPEQYTEQKARMPKLHPLLKVLFEEAGPATAELLGEERIRWLRSFPRNWRSESVFLLHASPDDLWRAPTPKDSDEDLTDAYGGLGTPTVVYCHIHRPFVRAIGNLTVANAGSAGLSWDKDPRASYLLIEDQVSIRRVEYDVERDIAELHRRRYPHAGWLGEMRRLGKFIQPR